MLEYLEKYCDNLGLEIRDAKIYAGDDVIGSINFRQNFVEIKSKKYKYGDFALLLIENCDVTGG